MTLPMGGGSGTRETMILNLFPYAHRTRVFSFLEKFAINPR